MTTNRDKFNAKLSEFIEKKVGLKKQYMYADEHQRRIDVLNSEDKSRQYYYYKLKYYVKNIDGVDFLYEIGKTAADGSKGIDRQLVHLGELYDVINDAHLKDTMHGGRIVMLEKLKEKYANVGREAVATYLSFCEICMQKRAKSNVKLVTNPIISNEMNSRGQVDLIDMQSDADGPYKWILNYQDHLTKFLHLRPMKTKTMREVADNLTDIFTSFGAPHILQRAV